MNKEQWNNLRIGDIIVGDKNKDNLNPRWRGKLATVVAVRGPRTSSVTNEIKIQRMNDGVEIWTTSSHFYIRQNDDAVDWRALTR